MIKQRILGTLLLLLPMTLVQSHYTSSIASDIEKNKNFSASDFDCNVRFSSSRGSGKCKLGVIDQKFVIELEGETIQFPIEQIFAFGANTNSGFGYKLRGDIHIGFITDLNSPAGNRTNFLYASTAYEKNFYALLQELSNQISTLSRIPFRETVTLQKSEPVDSVEVAKRVSQLIATKTCVRCDLRFAKLEAADLTGANLEGSNLQGANLAGSNLQWAYLVGATLDEANLRKADLNNAWLARASLVNANLEEARIYGNLQGANFANAVLRKVKFDSGVIRPQPNDMSYVNLGNADLSGAVLTGAILQGANLQDANLQGANLSKPSGIIRRTDLTGANLRGANLSKANLEDAIFIRANLQQANLTDTDLRNAALTRSNLQGANLTNADLRNAKLCGATMPDGTTSTQKCER